MLIGFTHLITMEVDIYRYILKDINSQKYSVAFHDLFKTESYFPWT